MWIILVILIILLFPFFRGYMAFRSMRNQAQEIFRQQQQQRQEAQRKAQRQAQGKSFGKDDSEYVDFEEVVEHKQSTSAGSSSTRDAGGTGEQQVSDAEFEDIA